MAEPEKSAGAESTGEIDAPGHTPIDMDRIRAAAEVASPRRSLADITSAGDDAEEDPAAAKPAEPPRRRLVAELLEGQETLEGTARPGLQIVAPPLHLETIDAGQPIYQLDLSSDEPEAVLVEPERPAPGPDGEDAPAGDPSDPSGAVPAAGREAVKKMIIQRDRQVMAAERDGVGAYELAVGLDAFVDKILQASREP
jgi:hypothetical protein